MKSDNAQRDVERLCRYVERFFVRHERTTWPTVRQAAKALGWRQVRIEDAIVGDTTERMILTSYPGDTLIGDFYVELNELDEAAD